MIQMFKRLFTPNYDPSLLREWDRHIVGSNYRNSSKGFMGMVYFFAATVVLALMLPALNAGGLLPANLKHLLQDGTVATILLAYLGGGGILFIAIWKAIVRYGGNTKDVVVKYYIEELKHYQKRVEQAQFVPVGQVQHYWEYLSPALKHEAIRKTYVRNCEVMGYNDNAAETFLRIVNTPNPTYDQLPAWVKSGVHIYSRFYYWDKEKMEYAGEVLRRFSGM